MAHQDVEQGGVVVGPSKARELIELQGTGEVSAEVSGGEDCEARLYSVSIETDDDGHCSIVRYYGYLDDSPQQGVDIWGTSSSLWRGGESLDDAPRRRKP